MAEESKMNADPLFVGLTRPPMLFGVSYTYFVLNAFINMIAYILTNEFKYLLVFFPIVHAIGYYICSKEPLFIDLFMIRSNKCSRCKNKFYHGANSYDPY